MFLKVLFVLQVFLMLDATINQEIFFAFVHICIHVERRERKTDHLLLFFTLRMLSYKV